MCPPKSDRLVQRRSSQWRHFENGDESNYIKLLKSALFATIATIISRDFPLALMIDSRAVMSAHSVTLSHLVPCLRHFTCTNPYQPIPTHIKNTIKRFKLYLWAITAIINSHDLLTVQFSLCYYKIVISNKKLLFYFN